MGQQCLDSLGVPRVEQYDISTDGACPGDRPKGEKKNKKYVPDCKYAATPDTPVEDDGGLRSVLRRYCGRVRGLRKPGWVPCRAQRKRGGGRMRWEPPNAEPRNSQPFSRPVFR